MWRAPSQLSAAQPSSRPLFNHLTWGRKKKSFKIISALSQVCSCCAPPPYCTLIHPPPPPCTSGATTMGQCCKVRETLMSHHKHSDSPLVKSEQYLFSYGCAAALSHPAGCRNLQEEPGIILHPPLPPSGRGTWRNLRFGENEHFRK